MLDSVTHTITAANRAGKTRANCRATLRGSSPLNLSSPTRGLSYPDRSLSQLVCLPFDKSAHCNRRQQTFQTALDARGHTFHAVPSIEPLPLPTPARCQLATEWKIERAPESPEIRSGTHCLPLSMFRSDQNDKPLTTDTCGLSRMRPIQKASTQQQPSPSTKTSSQLTSVLTHRCGNLATVTVVYTSFCFTRSTRNRPSLRTLPLLLVASMPVDF